MSILGKLLGLASKSANQEIVEEYQRTLDALAKSDIPYLEAYAKTIPDFPKGKDTFVERYWLTNAIDVGSVESIQWILDQNVDVNYQDDEGYSPLKSAICREIGDELEVVSMVLRAGAEVNAPGTLEVTPLHTAAAMGSHDVVKYLLDHGADPYAWDTDYVPRQPIDFAKGRENVTATLQAFMDRTPDPNTRPEV